MHLYSWIASGAVQVTTHPHKDADLHFLTYTAAFFFFLQILFLEWRLVYVIASICPLG